MKQKHCCSYFAIRRIRLVGLVKWQGWYWILWRPGDGTSDE